MIRCEDVHKHFGGVKAVNGATLEIAEGSITGLIGPNGAGKTTLFNCIAGAFPPTSGRIFLGDEDITGLKPHELFEKGVLRTFQIAHEFSTLTVRDNLMMVPGGQSGERLWDAWFSPAKVRAEERAIREKADEVIEFLSISHVADELAGNLSGGQKKLLEIGRTMMNDSNVVLLDEPGAGVNPTLMRKVAEMIEQLNTERGYTFCIIEHDMDMIARLCGKVVVLAEGQVLMEGTMDEVRSDERVIDAYFGGEVV